MKQQLLVLILSLCLGNTLVAQQTYLETYGTVQTDINRAHEIVQLNDTTFVLGGEWNGTGFLMKINHKGILQDYFFLDGVIPGNSAILDMTTDINNNIIATGECDHCVTGDTLKKVFTIATEPSLLLINSEIYDGSTPSYNLLYTPAIARKGNQFVLAATTGGLGLNFEDVQLMSITANLNATWTQTFNSCGNCGFDYVADIEPTAGGFAVLVLNAFTDSLTLYHVNESGNILWQKRHPVAAGSSYFKLAYKSGVIYACGSEQISGQLGGFIRRFSETDGALLGKMNIDLPTVGDEIFGLHFANDGTLLAIHRRAEPNSFGTYQVSRVYRVNTTTSQVLDYTEIPNPDVLTNMGATAVIPLNETGSQFAAVGIRGFYNRSFFFSKNSNQPVPPGTMFTASPDTACSPANIALNNLLPGALTYSWKLDGIVFSTAQNPGQVTVTGVGQHQITLQATTASQYKVTNFKVTGLPEIWNECAFCDNTPDVYLVIKNAAGVILFTSAFVESDPPISLAVNFNMAVAQTYKFEIWDDDNVGADDFFGSFNIPGNSPGGNFSFTNAQDPSHPLKISFTTTPITLTQTNNVSILVYQPSASLQMGNTLTATTGSPAPASYTWQWYLNGQPVNGATAATFVPTVGGSYAVAMVTPDCSALSNAVQFSPVLASVGLVATRPLCFGEANGELEATPVGGTPPYNYVWNPVNLSGSNPTGLAAGDYSVTVTDATGNTITGQTTLTQPAELTAASTFENPGCANESSGAILVTADGGTAPFSYAWNQANLSGNNPTDLPEGSYTVTVTDANGCSVTAGTDLVSPPLLTAATSAENPACANESSGSILVTPDGGTAPFAYNWDPSTLAGSNPTDLPEGNYAVTVTDANGCTATAQAELIEPPLLAATTSAQNPACANGSDGSILVTMDGGLAPFHYDWDPATLDGNNPTGLSSGNYAVTVTDANGCTATAALSLTAPPALTASTTSTPESGTTLGTATVVPAGGTSPYSFLWNDASQQTTATATGLTGGDYSVVVTDANGCTFEATILVEKVNATGEAALPTLAIFPNPTSGTVYLGIEELRNWGIGGLEIWDATGRLLRSEKMTKLPASVDFSAFSDGVYLLSLKFEEGTVSGRVVVVR